MIYGMDVKADYRIQVGMAIAIGSRNSMAVITGLTDDAPALPPIYRFRYWPRWVCWFFGHEPAVHIDDYSRDRMRCLCGVHEVGRFEFLLGLRPWAVFTRRAWRWLP